jgi:hypothetical protein
MKGHVLAVVSACLATAVVGPVTASVPRYHLVELTGISGGKVNTLNINNQGVVVGSETLSDLSCQPLMWSGGSATLLPGPKINPNAINDSGVIAGEGGTIIQRHRHPLPLAYPAHTHGVDRMFDYSRHSGVCRVRPTVLMHNLRKETSQLVWPWDRSIEVEV